MSLQKRLVPLFLASALTFTSVAFAQEAPSALLSLQHQWAKVNYEYEGETKLTALHQLIADAEVLSQQTHHSAEALTWLAISQSSTASAKGGLGALKYAQSAKENLEKAIEQDEGVLEGTALTVLAALYHKVPGWPVSFGSDKKAHSLFTRALEINPTGMDQNFFYAEFLFDEGDHEKALSHLSIAASAPQKPNRPLADKKRREEIHALQNVITKSR